MPDQQLLITPDDLPRYATTGEFMQQFELRELVVAITVGGPLGQMAFTWCCIGDPNPSVALQSADLPVWTKRLPDPGFGALSFQAGDYIVDTAYRVGAAGSVVADAGAFAGLSAMRIDPATDVCWSVTDDTATWMQPRQKPPILSVGPGLKRLMAELAVWRLKLRQGVTPTGAGEGDSNIKAEAAKVELAIQAIGRSDNRPPSLVDNSPGGKGSGIPLMPRSRSPRGFGDFS